MSEYNINKIELPNGDICHLKDEETQILKNDKVSIVDINSNITKGVIPSSDIWTSILYRYENGTGREQSNRLFSIDGAVKATTGENTLRLSVYKNEANSTYHSYFSVNYSSNPYVITNGNFYALGNMYSGESTATSDRIIKTESNSGAISLYSTGNANGDGDRGIYLYAHGTGSGKSIIIADTNNNISYIGGTFLTKITQARAGEATISVKNTNYNHEVALAASSATSQSAGVYDLTNSKWLIYSDSTGAVYVNGLSNEAKKLSLYETRTNTTTLNKAVNYGGAGAMLHLVATSSTATTNNGKPPFGDSNILQMNWDNNGEYDSQLAISTSGASSDDSTLSMTRMAFRGRSSTSSPWREVVTIKPGAAIGSTNQPAYITAEGRAYACSTIDVAHGGTGATSAAVARSNLGITPLENTLTSIVETKTLTVDKNSAVKINAYIAGGGAIGLKNTCALIYFKCKPNTTYTIKKIATARFRTGYTTSIPASSTKPSGIIDNSSATSVDITTSSTAKYLVVYYYDGDNETNTEETIFNSLEITYGTEVTAIDKTKVEKNQNTINAGRSMIIDTDGSVVPGKIDISAAVDALLLCAQHITWDDVNGASYVSNLENTLKGIVFKWNYTEGSPLDKGCVLNHSENISTSMTSTGFQINPTVHNAGGIMVPPAYQKKLSTCTYEYDFIPISLNTNNGWDGIWIELYGNVGFPWVMFHSDGVYIESYPSTTYNLAINTQYTLKINKDGVYINDTKMCINDLTNIDDGYAVFGAAGTGTSIKITEIRVRY